MEDEVAGLSVQAARQDVIGCAAADQDADPGGGVGTDVVAAAELGERTAGARVNGQDGVEAAAECIRLQDTALRWSVLIPNAIAESGTGRNREGGWGVCVLAVETPKGAPPLVVPRRASDEGQRGVQFPEASLSPASQYKV